MGCPEGGITGGHLCRCLMGIAGHLLQILPGECRHSPSTGRGPVAGILWFSSMRFVLGILRDLAGISHSVL